MRIDLGGGGEFVLDRIQTPASLSLNLERTMNQGMQMASRGWIRHRKGFFLRASGAQVHPYLGVNPAKPIWDYRPPDMPDNALCY